MGGGKRQHDITNTTVSSGYTTGKNINRTCTCMDYRQLEQCLHFDTMYMYHLGTPVIKDIREFTWTVVHIIYECPQYQVIIKCIWYSNGAMGLENLSTYNYVR